VPGGGPGSASGDWRADDVDHAGVVAFMNSLATKASGSPHGVFWRKPYAEFVEFKFTLNTGEGEVRLIEKGDGANSNLVKALEGKPLTAVAPDGKRVEVPLSKAMPPRGQKATPEQIEKIRRWIDHGAPEKRP
jgi:hypothetical protein